MWARMIAGLGGPGGLAVAAPTAGALAQARRRAGMRWARTWRPSSPTRSITVFGAVSVSTPIAVMSWSRAALSAMLKLARSGSTSGRVSTASLIAIRRAW